MFMQCKSAHRPCCAHTPPHITHSPVGVEHRLEPTFNALYGPGTSLGGQAGKKMVVIMDNAPYHHRRSFISFSALKTKKEIIEQMVKIGVKNVTLPANAARATEVRIDLSETFDSSLPNAPDDKDGHTSKESERETTKFKYAERATSDGLIPTIPDLKDACVAELNKSTHRHLLQCDVQKFLHGKGHRWLWTPPYCPWLQPVTFPLPPHAPSCPLPTRRLRKPLLTRLDGRAD